MLKMMSSATASSLVQWQLLPAIPADYCQGHAGGGGVENTLVASLCDLIERMFRHGLKANEVLVSTHALTHYACRASLLSGRFLSIASAMYRLSSLPTTKW